MILKTTCKARRRTMKGIITDIQRTSYHDGKGIRTTVFLKGCPLRCEWCHNPECISFEPQMMYYPDKCIGCGKCDEGCYSGARVMCGREVEPEDVLREVSYDMPYYADGGGVTFSGGEPFAQPGFLDETCTLCRKAGIGCAVETSLYIYNEEILGKMDFVMADLKIWDSDTHMRYTGVGNETIKENFGRLDRLGIPVIVRTPVIPGIDQGIDRISSFAFSLKNAVRYELLPYHPLGNQKREALMQKAPEFETPAKEYMKEVGEYAFIR